MKLVWPRSGRRSTSLSNGGSRSRSSRSRSRAYPRSTRDFVVRRRRRRSWSTRTSSRSTVSASRTASPSSRCPVSREALSPRVRAATFARDDLRVGRRPRLGPGRGPRPGNHPPRHQGGERPRRPERPDRPRGFRTRQEHGRLIQPDRRRDADGDADVPVPRAIEGRVADARLRPVFARGPRLPDADGKASLGAERRARPHDDADRVSRPARAVVPPSRGRSGGGRGLRQGAGEEAGWAFRELRCVRHGSPRSAPAAPAFPTRRHTDGDQARSSSFGGSTPRSTTSSSRRRRGSSASRRRRFEAGLSPRRPG